MNSGPDQSVIFVARDREDFAARAFSLLGALPLTLPSWALVGGVAVAVNLAGFHRATADLDSVSIDGDAAIAVLTQHGASRSGLGVEFAGQGTATVKFDIIDVSIGADDDPSYLAHRFGLDTMRIRTIVVTDRSGQVLTTIEIPVATPAALVAMKLQAVELRRQSRPEKRSGDLCDIVRLVSAFTPKSIAADFKAHAPQLLVESTRSKCHKYFDSDAARTLNMLRIDRWSEMTGSSS